ncbi:hypothetical protein DFJ74DRAFT_715363 [Hyaloraphidium curvatum]|nr:hypothetical protein DFJ74DRAFT_760676 [Hyaloraphidium curvatum]KAI9034193.1 hypothetical protein DFJ74DRAFT_715363 [Hyaloraphidium curvatum]
METLGNALSLPADAPARAQDADDAPPDGGPNFPPELSLIFGELASCALASKATFDLALPVLYGRITHADAHAESFLDAARRHADLVRILDLGPPHFEETDTALIVECLRLFKDLREVALNLYRANEDGTVGRLIAGLTGLERLKLDVGGEWNFDRDFLAEALPPSLKHLSWAGGFPADVPRLLAALGAAELESLALDLTQDGAPDGLYVRLAQMQHVVSAIDSLSLAVLELFGAQALFENPAFAPRRLLISLTFRYEEPVPPSLGRLRGLEVLELRMGETACLVELGPLPPPCKAARALDLLPVLGSGVASRRGAGAGKQVWAGVVPNLGSSFTAGAEAETNMWRRITGGPLYEEGRSLAVVAAASAD